MYYTAINFYVYVLLVEKLESQRNIVLVLGQMPMLGITIFFVFGVYQCHVLIGSCKEKMIRISSAIRKRVVLY
jgi:hypothetical protein